MAVSTGTISAGTISVGLNLSQAQQQANTFFNKVRQFNISVNGAQQFSRLAADAQEFDRQLQFAYRRVLSFSSAGAAFFGVANALKSLANATIQVEKTLTDINAIFQSSTRELASFSREIFKIGNETGQSFFEAADAAKEFARQGLNLNETLKRTKDALLLTRLAGLNVQDSINAVTASVNSYSGSLLSSTEVVNKLIAVDNRFATSASSLAEAIQRSASAAQDAGLSFDEYLGLITAIQQRTARAGSVIGNSLKTIFARVSDVDTIQRLKEFGIEIDRSSNAVEKLKLVAKAIEIDPQFADEVRKIVGGVYQLNAVSAAFRDLSSANSDFAKVVSVSANATDEAIVRNKLYKDTLVDLINVTKNNLTQAGSNIGNLTFAPVAKSLLQTVNKGSGPIFGLEGLNKNLEQDGFSLGRALVKGLGDFISGPGLLGIGIAVGRLFAEFAKKGSVALFSFINIQDALKKADQTMIQLNRSSSRQASIVNNIATAAGKNLATQQQILGVIQQQNSALAQGAGLTAANGGFAGKSFNPSITSSFPSGLGPVATNINASQSAKNSSATVFASQVGIAPVLSQSDLERRGGTFGAVLGIQNTQLGQQKVAEINSILKQITSGAAGGGLPPQQIATLANQAYKIIENRFAEGGARDFNKAVVRDLVKGASSAGKAFFSQNNAFSFSASSNVGSGVPFVVSTPSSAPPLLNSPNPRAVPFQRVFPAAPTTPPPLTQSNIYTTGSPNPSQAFSFTPQFPLPPRTPFSFATATPPTASQQLGFLPPGFNAKDGNARGFRLGSSALTILAPLAGGAISEGISAIVPRSQASSPLVRGSQALADEGGQVLGQAGLGFAVGGPWGAAIGGLFGLSRSLPKIIESFSSLMPQLNERFEVASSSLEALRSSLNDFVTTSEKLAEIYEKRLNISGQKIAELEASRNASLIAAGLTEKQKSDILNAKTPEERDAFVQSILKNAVQAKNDADQERITRSAQENVSIFNKIKPGILNLDSSGVLRSLIPSLNFATLLQQDRPSALVQKTKEGGFELNKEGTVTVGTIFRDILSQTNGSGDAFIKLLENQETVNKLLEKNQGTQIITELQKLAESGGFQTAGQRLGQLSSTDFGTTFPQAVAKFLGERIKQIPETTANLRRIDKSVAESNVEKEREREAANSSLLSLAAEFETKARENSLSKIIESNLVNNVENVQAAARNNSFSLTAPFLSDVQNLSNKGAIDISDIQRKTGQDLRENLKNFSVEVNDTLANGISQFLNRTSDILNKGKNLPDFARRAVLQDAQTDASRIGSFIGNVSSPQGAGELLGQLSSGLTTVEAAIAQGGLTDSRKSELENLKDFYSKILENLGKIFAKFEESNTIAEQNRDAATKTAVGANNTEINLKNIQDSLNRAGRGSIIGNNLFNARETLNLGRNLGDENLKREGIAGLLSGYQQSGLPVPLDIQQMAKEMVDSKESIKEIPVILESVRNSIQNSNQLFSSQNERLTVITSLEEKRVEIQKKINLGIEDSIQGQRKYALELNKILAAQSLTAFRRGDITGQQFRDQQEALRNSEQDANGGRLSNQSIGEAFFDEFRYNTRDFYDDIENGARTTAQTIKSSFKDAFNSFKDGSKDAGEAFQDFLLGIGNKIGDIALDIALNNIFGAAFGSLGNAFSVRRNSGGIVNKYSTGGLVQGGSGVTDDVPASLTSGEYVIKKAAVQKYGPELLTKLNEGKAFFDGKNSIVVTDGSRGINAAFANTYLYDDPNKPTSGEFLTDPNLSSFALEDENNPQNQIKFGREGALGDYLRDRAAYDEQVAAALRAFKKQKKQAATAALIQAGISLVGIGIGAKANSIAAKTSSQSLQSAATGSTVVSQPITTSGVSYASGANLGARGGFSNSNFGLSPSPNYYQGFGYSSPPPIIRKGMGGEIPYRRYADGGEVRALLTGGEFVFNRKPVQNNGRQFFDKLNRGEIQVRKAEGGMVGDSPSAPYSANDGIDRLIKVLESSSGKGGVVLNQEVNITIDKSGSVSENSSSNNSGQNGNSNDRDANQSRQLAESMKTMVLTVIQTELKPGGLIRNMISAS